MAGPGYDVRVSGFPPTEFAWGSSTATPHCSGVAALMFDKGGRALDAYLARTKLFDSAFTYEYTNTWCFEEPHPKHMDALRAVNAITGGIPCITPGDIDCDDAISLLDFRTFASCMAGPDGGPIAGTCTRVDFPASPPDGHVDMRDLAAFQRAFTGFGDRQGACCRVDGSCTEGPLGECFNDPTAIYQGDDTTCATVECPLPNWGACCDVASQTCTESTQEDCAFSEGLYLGDGTDCASATCPTARYQNVIDPLTTYITAGPGLTLADDITLSGTGGGELVFYDLNVFGRGGGTFDVTVGLYTDCPGAGGTLIPGTERTFTNNPDGGSPVFLEATFSPPVSIPNRFWMVAEFSNSTAGWFRAEQAEIGYTADYFGRNDPPWVCSYWWGGNPYAGFWANIGCVEPQGACCHPDESCTEGTQVQCSAAGGNYQGPDTLCAGTDCSATNLGACCNSDDGTCTDGLTQTACTAGGGTYQGNGTVCAGVTCPFGRYSNEIDPVAGYASRGVQASALGAFTPRALTCAYGRGMGKQQRGTNRRTPKNRSHNPLQTSHLVEKRRTNPC